MSVTVTATSAVLGLVYLRRIKVAPLREGVLAGLIWLVVCIAIDAPLMLLGGPMKMSFGAYMADIGLTYASIPIVTSSLAAARRTPGVL
jgi:hypothetical protein